MNPLENTETEEKQAFEIKDLNGANWALRKLSSIAEKQKEINDLYENELQRINAWRDKESEQLKNDNEYFENLLASYYFEQKRINPKFKISTPYGKVSSRKQQPKWQYNDEILLSSLKENELNDYIKISETIDKAALKNTVSIVNGIVVSEDGIVLDGVIVDERDEAIVIKPE